MFVGGITDSGGKLGYMNKCGGSGEKGKAIGMVMSKLWRADQSLPCKTFDWGISVWLDSAVENIVWGVGKGES